MVLLCYLALFGGLILGLVAIGLVWEWRIESYQEELATVRANIADHQAFVREIEKKSGGVKYRDSSEGQYLLLPPGSSPYYSLERGLDRGSAEEVRAEAIYERAGDAVVDRVRAIGETLRGADAALRATDAALRGAESAAQRAGRGLNEAGRRLDGASRGVGGASQGVTAASAALKQQEQARERKQLEAENEGPEL